MELITDKVYEVREFYDWALSVSDKRVQDWFLMGSCLPTIGLTIAYLIAVWLGQKLMKDRKPMQLKLALFLYNVVLVVINYHIASELFICSWRRDYSYFCQPVNYTDDPDEIRIAKAIWWFYFSKLLEMFDTFFFILRKKNNQVSFLHVYHHATMFPLWWIGVMWVAGGQAFLGAMVNSSIHILMYTYYGLSGLGPRIQKYLWWKRYLTMLQLIQFVSGMSHAVVSLWFNCDFPRWMLWALIIYGSSILLLFLNFYFHTYIKQGKDPKEKESHAHGELINGYLSKLKYLPATKDHIQPKKEQ